MAIDPITITGTFYEADGTTPATGTVEFILTHELRDTTSDRIYVRSAEKVTLESGAIPAGVTLIPTTHPDLAPTGAQYLVRQEFPATRMVREYHVAIPHDSGATINLADLVEGTAGTVSYLREHWNILEFAYDDAGQAVRIDTGEYNATDAYYAAVAQANVSGGVVFLPRGTFLIDWRASGDILDDSDGVLQDWVTLEGAGPGATIIKGNAAAANAMPDDGRDLKLVVCNSNATVRNLTIDGDKASIVDRADPIVSVLLAVRQGFHNPTFQHLHLKNCYGADSREAWALGVSQTVGGTLDHILIEDSDGSGVSISGAYPTNLPSRDINISNLTVRRCRWSALTFHAAQDCQLTNFVSEYCGGLGLGTGGNGIGNGLNFEYADGIVVTNATVRGALRYNINFLGATRNIRLTNVRTENASDPAYWGAAAPSYGELRFSQHSWVNGGTNRGVPQGIEFVNCQFVPQSGGAVINYGDVDPALPNHVGTSNYEVSFTSCTDGAGRGPEYWTTYQGTNADRILGTLRLRGNAGLKTVTTPDLDAGGGGANWTLGSDLTITDGHVVDGSLASVVWLVDVATVSPTAANRLMTWALPQQQGKQRVRLRLLPQRQTQLLQIGFYETSGGTFKGVWRKTPAAEDLVGPDGWIEVIVYSRFNDFDSDHVFAIQFSANADVYIDGLPEISVLESYGALA